MSKEKRRARARSVGSVGWGGWEVEGEVDGEKEGEGLESCCCSNSERRCVEYCTMVLNSGRKRSYADSLMKNAARREIWLVKAETESVSAEMASWPPMAWERDSRGAKASVQAVSSCFSEACSAWMSDCERAELVLGRGILPSIHGIGWGVDWRAHGMGVILRGRGLCCGPRGWMEWL